MELTTINPRVAGINVSKHTSKDGEHYYTLVLEEGRPEEAQGSVCYVLFRSLAELSGFSTELSFHVQDADYEHEINKLMKESATNDVR
jgi:hypothetical protein|tara:strand:- start:2327 stop:2590 length:264 start_codon:yes stop_codon:yes gene_type:complete